MGATVVTWAHLVHLGRRAALAFKLPRAAQLRFEPVAPHRHVRLDGECYPNGVIHLRTHRVGRVNQPLAQSTLFAALSHELAHLKHGEHGAEHGELTRQIAAWLRAQGRPVAHRIHSGVGKAPAAPRPSFKRAWKRPKARAG